MPNVPETVKGSGGRIMAWAKKNPALAIGAVAGVAILAVIAIKNNQGDNSTDQNPGMEGGAGPGETPAVIPEIPVPDVGPITPPKTGGGGSDYLAKQKANKLDTYSTDPGQVVTPDGGGMSILDALWANSVLTGEPLPFDPNNPALFESPAANALINSIPSDPYTAQLIDQMLHGNANVVGDLVPPGGLGGGSVNPNPIGGGPVPPAINMKPVNPGGKTGGQVTTTISEDIANIQTGAADIVSNVQDWAAGLVNQVNSIFGGILPGATTTPGGSWSGSENSLQPSGTGAGVSGSVDLSTIVKKTDTGPKKGTSPIIPVDVTLTQNNYSSGPGGKSGYSQKHTGKGSGTGGAGTGPKPQKKQRK